jgi:hypothetical protein
VPAASTLRGRAAEFTSTASRRPPHGVESIVESTPHARSRTIVPERAIAAIHATPESARTATRVLPTSYPEAATSIVYEPGPDIGSSTRPSESTLRHWPFDVNRARADGKGCPVSMFRTRPRSESTPGVTERVAIVDALGSRGTHWMMRQPTLLATPSRSRDGHTDVRREAKRLRREGHVADNTKAAMGHVNVLTN